MMAAMGLSALDPGRTPLKLRPQGVGEIFDEGFRLYRSNFALFATLGLLTAVPTAAQSLLAGGAHAQGQLWSSIFSGVSSGGFSRVTPANVPWPMVLAGYAIVLVTAPFVWGLITQATIDLAAGGKPSVGHVVRQVAARYWHLVGVLAILALGVLPVITCILIPLTIWLLVRWSVAIPALLAEGAGPIRAIERSSYLTRANWWRMFGISILATILVAVIELALGGVVGLVLGLMPGLPVDARGGGIVLGSAVIGGLLQPITGIIYVLLYFDLRIRKESMELDILAGQAMPPSEPPALSPT